MEIADTLSRAYLPNVLPSKFESTVEAINMLQFSDRLEDIQHQTEKIWLYRSYVQPSAMACQKTETPFRISLALTLMYEMN